MILVHCESFLRTDTITALAGGETERASQIDDAFWRVWTFCRIFGCGTSREDDVTAQMDWLRGGILAKQRRHEGNSSDSPSFGQGNNRGLTAEDLYDMTEIWTCLGVLVRGFQGKRDLARKVGIFEHADIALGDVEREDATLGTSSSVFFRENQLMCSRGVDLPPPYPGTPRSPCRYHSWQPHRGHLRSCSEPRLHDLGTTCSFSLHLLKGSCLPRL